MPALVRVENLGPFFNTLAADDKYSRRNMQNFQQQLQLHYLKNKRFFLQFLLLFSNLGQIYNLSKKKVSLLVSVFRNYWLRKRWLLECLKRLAPEHLSAINVFTSSKHCQNKHEITIILLFHEYGIN